ncbi:rod-binding protein [Azotobacter chroococcum]
MAVAALGERFALDLQGLQRLKHTAREDSPAALREASKQFEALFLQSMLKSMREASPKSGLFDSSQTRLYTELLDQQWAQHLAGHGLGLAEQLAGQLRGAAPATDPAQSARRRTCWPGFRAPRHGPCTAAWRCRPLRRAQPNGRRRRRPRWAAWWSARPMSRTSSTACRRRHAGPAAPAACPPN